MPVHLGPVKQALSQIIPDPDDGADRRVGSRHISILRVGRIELDGQDQLCVVRNISPTGLMLECLRPPALGQHLLVELRSDKRLPGTVRWSREGQIGLQFDSPINVEQVLHEDRSSLLRVRPRAPRFVRRGHVRLIPTEGDPMLGDIVDISISGVSCRTERPVHKGEPIVAALDGVGVANAEIRWVRGDMAGIRFEKPFPWRAFGTWLDTAPVISTDA